MALETVVSEVGICNLALSHLGKPSITSLTEGTKEAVLCNAAYEFARRLVLVRSPWTFARRTQVLAQLVTNDQSDVWGFAYDMPDSALKLHRLVAPGERVNWNTSPYDQYIEAGVIFTNLPDAKAAFIFDNKDVLSWSPDFADAVSFKLAEKLVPNMTRRREDARDMLQLYTDALGRAIETDAQQESNYYRYGDGYADDRGTGSSSGRRQSDGSSFYDNA